MKSHSDTIGHESSLTAQHQSGGAKHRPLRSRALGVAVALCVPALALGIAACGSSASATTPPASTTATTSTTAAQTSGSSGSASLKGSGSGFNARSTNAAGGSVGTVTGKSGSRFTVSTPTGGKTTVTETSSTVYDKGTTKSAASTITTGATVLVLGKVDSTTITATEVIVAPAINLSKASANVIAFKSPNTSTSKSVGQIPASYKQGSGTLVSGADATKATEASLSSYAGGVVDRVVRLSNGDYEVHNIGSNWPHHVFETSNFKVIGAND
jgi:hypothetical protein